MRLPLYRNLVGHYFAVADTFSVDEDRGPASRSRDLQTSAWHVETAHSSTSRSSLDVAAPEIPTAEGGPFARDLPIARMINSSAGSDVTTLCTVSSAQA